MICVPERVSRFETPGFALRGCAAAKTTAPKKTAASKNSRGHGGAGGEVVKLTFAGDGVKAAAVPPCEVPLTG